jgi:hypothetical protein
MKIEHKKKTEKKCIIGDIYHLQFYGTAFIFFFGSYTVFTIFFFGFPTF